MAKLKIGVLLQLSALFLPACEALAHLGSGWDTVYIDMPESSRAVGDRGTLGEAREPGDRPSPIRANSILSAALAAFFMGSQGPRRGRA